VNLPEAEIMSVTEDIAKLRNATKSFDGINERNRWGFYGSEIESYISSFSTVLPVDLLEFFREKQSPVIIDLMAHTGSIRNLCNRTGIVPKIAVSVSLQDQRTKGEKDADANLNIYQLAGNLLNFETWRKLSAMLSEQKADLIMERAVLGLIHIPGSKKFYNLALRGLWNILDENEGLLLLQTHNIQQLQKTGVNLINWVKEVEKCGVTVNLDAKKRALMLQKHPNSSIDLPKF